jgi:hypothetical protein
LAADTQTSPQTLAGLLRGGAVTVLQRNIAVVFAFTRVVTAEIAGVIVVVTGTGPLSQVTVNTALLRMMLTAPAMTSPL